MAAPPLPHLPAGRPGHARACPEDASGTWLTHPELQALEHDPNATIPALESPEQYLLFVTGGSTHYAHAYEWPLWEDIPLPEGKVLIPGVIAHTTAGGRASRNGSRAHHELPRVVSGASHRRGPTVALPRGPVRRGPDRHVAKFKALASRSADSPRSALAVVVPLARIEGRRVPGKEPL